VIRLSVAAFHLPRSQVVSQSYIILLSHCKCKRFSYELSTSTQLNSDIDKKFSSNWVNYSGKSLFDIFVPISPTGIYSIADADDTPTVGMKWFVLIKTTERMILFHDTGVYFTRSDGNIWKRVWIKI